MHYQIGTIFSSPSLKFCLRDACWNSNSQQAEISKTSLYPNPVQRESVGKADAIWSGSKKMGYFDVRAIDETRAEALWVITEVETDPSGGGYSHCVSGRSESWATHLYRAKRINPDLSDHESKETLWFNRTFHMKEMILIQVITI